MKIQIADIRIGRRFRDDKGDIAGLARSMAQLGQLTPVITDSAGNLLAGERRILAARSLGWAEIEAVQYEPGTAAARLLVERDENCARKDFTNAELARLGREILAVESEAAKARRAHGKTAPGVTLRASPPSALPARARDLAGAAVGMGGRTLEDAVKTVDHIDLLRENGRHKRADKIEQVMNDRGVSAAARMLPNVKEPEFKEPPKTDDKALAVHVVRTIYGAIIGGAELIEQFPAGDLIEDHMIPEFEILAAWLARWKKKPHLRVV